MKVLAVVCLSLIVGVSAMKQPLEKIVGGQPAERGRFPWQVGLYDLATASSFLCGGSLITPGIVLSAAHCGYPTYAKVGCLLSNEACEQTGVVSAHIHPDFSNGNAPYFNDFSLLGLAREIASVPPIAFVADASFDDLPTGLDVTVIGWGRTGQDEDLSLPLLEVEVEIVDQEVCIEQYAVQSYTIDETMICAASPGKDSCQGDSGGPLFIRCDANGNDVQVGVVSWGLICADPDFPGVYARISNARDWIDEVLNEQGIALAAPDVNQICTGPTAPVAVPSPVPAPVPITFPTIFPGWICPSEYFDSRDGCDCQCGAHDPDCDIFGQSVHNCEDGQTCVGGICVGDVLPPTPEPVLPDEWICFAPYFNDNMYCDCNCGAPDPDCAPAQVSDNCEPDQVCVEGLCVTDDSTTETLQPTIEPTVVATAQPTLVPISSSPTGAPLPPPTGFPSFQPTHTPSGRPSQQPTDNPTVTPSRNPSHQPTTRPSQHPTGQPSQQPAYIPTSHPSDSPSGKPTSYPTRNPTFSPTQVPSESPSSRDPTLEPSQNSSTIAPTSEPPVLASVPTVQPTGTKSPVVITDLEVSGPNRIIAVVLLAIFGLLLAILVLGIFREQTRKPVAYTTEPGQPEFFESL